MRSDASELIYYYRFSLKDIATLLNLDSFEKALVS